MPDIWFTFGFVIGIEMTFSDDIPVRGFIGHLEEGGFLPHNHKIYLWSHLHFNIEYNGDQVRNKQHVTIIKKERKVLYMYKKYAHSLLALPD